MAPRIMSSLSRRRLRTPTAEEAWLCEPPASALPSLIADNLAAAPLRDVDLLGRPLTDVAAEARRSMLDAARRYTASYRDLPELPDSHTSSSSTSSPKVYLAGHQAELYHPGVWVKNVLLDRLAKADDAVAVNLVVDGDLFKQASVRAPSGSPQNPGRQSIPFDLPAPETPAEERRLVDIDCWRSFGRRAAQAVAAFSPNPMVERFWPTAVERVESGEGPAYALAQARHRWEGGWGMSTLEVPITHTFRDPSFFWFTAHVLAHLPRFREVYNAAVLSYRRRYRLRSLNHPAPVLVEENGWLEAPFWVWSSAAPERRRLFARRKHGCLELHDGRNWTCELPLSADGAGDATVDALLSAARSSASPSGVKIRTRALTTTLWARLFLGDFFIHGIGGAKYDEVTDGILERFYGLEPPHYAAASATLLLPAARTAHAPHVDESIRLRQQLRELRYNPDRSLDAGLLSSLSPADRAAAEQAAAAKQSALRLPKTWENARERHLAVEAANDVLRPLVARRQTPLLEALADHDHARRVWSTLGSREYSFTFFSDDELRDFFLAFADANSYS